MPDSIRLADPAMGQLMTLTDDDWTNISQFVGIVLDLRRGWAQLGSEMPGFYVFASVTCVAWRNTTFPGISIMSGAIDEYADSASKALTALQSQITGLKAGDTLSQQTLTQARDFFAALAAGTAILARLADMITSGINDFATRYDVCAAAAARQLGESVSTDRVSLAAGKLNGAWHAISDDLNQVMAGEIPITSTFLLSLDIDMTLRSWAGLRNEARTFQGIAPNQQKILDTGWNGGMAQQQEG